MLPTTAFRGAPSLHDLWSELTMLNVALAVLERALTTTPMEAPYHARAPEDWLAAYA